MAKIKQQDKPNTEAPKQAITPDDYIFVPDIETEVEFLERILKIQKEGGFGTHLNEIIKARIKAINNGS